MNLYLAMVKKPARAGIMAPIYMEHKEYYVFAENDNEAIKKLSGKGEIYNITRLASESDRTLVL